MMFPGMPWEADIALESIFKAPRPCSQSGRQCIVGRSQAGWPSSTPSQMPEMLKLVANEKFQNSPCNEDERHCCQL